jgi:hypothetical protein
MVRKAIALAALSVCGMAALAPEAKAQNAPANPWELTLGGSASNGPDFNGINAAVNVGIGYYISPEIEFGLRQSLTYTDVGATGNGGSALNASTRLAVDYHFIFGEHSEWQPYIGANIGFVYGDTVKDTFEAAPEAGIKYYVNPNTFIFASVEYQFFFDKNSDAGASFSDGQFVYGLGIGFRF